MASVDPEARRAGGRKSQKRSRNLNRLPSSQIPARLRYGDDIDEDVTAPSRAGQAAPQYMNQSIFSMIAAAGSRTDFNKRFDESSDSEEDNEGGAGKEDELANIAGAAVTSIQDIPRDERTERADKDADKSRKKKRLSGQRLMQSLPRLSLRTSKMKQTTTRSRSPRSPSSDHTSESVGSNPRDAPVMSMLLNAEAGHQAQDAGQQESSRKSQDKTRKRAESTPATLLATRLMEIFGFEKPEKVIAEYPCWLLQSVLLQGYLYLTKQHICFFAYLPKKSHVTVKTGYLGKRGKTNPSYRRYWFTLKGDVLSYYSDPSNRYFPQGNIDLRYAGSASLLPEKEKKRDSKDFSITTDNRTYNFRADSAASAKEWVKSLQRAMFRSHNDGDSVKISLPVDNVIDIEKTSVVEFAETVKVRVVESGDSYAIDEYFFSFFSHGEDALSALGSLIDDSPNRRMSQDLLSAASDPATVPDARKQSPGPRMSLDALSASPRDTSPMPLIKENVKATLTPYMLTEDGKMSPRMSGEFSRPGRSPVRSSIDNGTGEYGRASFDRGRRSDSTARLAVESGRRSGRSPLTRHQDSVDSYTQSSVDKDTDSAIPISPSADARMSASQILTRSDVFKTPAVQRMATLQSVSTGENEKTSDYDATSPSANRLDSINNKLVSDRKGKLKVDAANSDASDTKHARNTPSPTLQELAGKVSAYPFVRAGAIAKYISKSSSKMSKALATESMSYYEKVTGMWQGGHKHYGENEGVVPDDKDVDPEDEEANVGHGDRFRTHFALPSTEKLQATYFGFLHRVLPLYGKIYVSNRLFCFRSLLPGTRTKIILPLKDVENVDKEKGFRFGYHGLVLVIRGHEELFFEFNSSDTRDDCTVTLLQSLETTKFLAESGTLAHEDEDEDEDQAVTAKAELRLLQEARGTALEANPPETANTVYSHTAESAPILFDDPKASIINFRPTTSLRITCLTIGSRGDVQPYIAFCKGLIADGHKPRIATHAEFGPWVKQYGIEFVPIGGDPAELMRICVENGMFTYSFLREASTKFRSWIDDLLSSAWAACQGSDLLIESPSAMAGIHIAEALGIPYFRAFTMPWTRTRAYPHAFAVPEHKIGGAYNYFSYVMFDNVFWKGIAGQVNRWRKRELGLRSTNLDKMQPNKVPFLYNFSPHVVVPPLDYSDWVRVTGYWFLDESNAFKPPDDLAAFIKKARADGKKLVYIGFGSIVVSDPAALTKTVVDSVLKADVRCILSKGWSDRLGDPSSNKTEVPLPEEIFQIKAAPHDWLFPQVDAAVHHGGAGTTGASLRAGVPTIIKPFFGDQFFFGGRVEDLGVGMLLRKINVTALGRALWEACHNERMITKAKRLGEKIREENGVATAIQAMYRDLEYARTLVKSRQMISKPVDGQQSSGVDAKSADAAHARLYDYDTEADLEGEESWTFIGDENEVDAELRKRMSGMVSSSGIIREQPRVSLDMLRPGAGTGSRVVSFGSVSGASTAAAGSSGNNGG